MHLSSLPALAFMAAAVVPALSAQADDDHGDIPEAATRLQIGQPVAGVLEHASDEDYFRVDVMGSGRVALSSAGPTDTVGLLFDGSGRPVASDDNSGTGRRNFHVQPRLEPGIYYLRVSGHAGSYAVTARLPRERDEHGETASDSTLLTLHTGADLKRIRPSVLLSTAGRIDPAGTDVDVFRIDVPHDGTDVVLRTAGATATEGRLLDSSMRQIASDAGTGNPFRIERQLDAGIYYIEVRGAMKGDYRLLASTPNTETECGCSCPSAGRAAADHGDTALTATLMPIGRPLTGTIAHADDIDVFRIDVALGTQLRLGTVGPTDTRGELRDAAGALLAFDDRSGPQGHNFSISAQLAAGVYYLAVSGDAGNYAVGAWPANAADHGHTPALSSLLPIHAESDAKRIRPSMLLSTAGRIADPDADIHVFRLDVAEDGTQVTLRTAGNAGAHLRLLGDAVPPVAALATSDDTSLEVELNAGIHYVEVRGSTAGRYRLLALSRSRPCDELPADAASVPSAPNNLVASSGDGQVLLAWVHPTVGADGILHHEFRQRRHDGTYGDWAEIPDSAPGGTNASGLRIAGLVNGVTMFFEVRAVNAVGTGEPSNEVAATPTRIRLSAPETVRTGDASRLGNGGEPQRFAVRPSAADLDGDGDLDLLVVHVGRQRQAGTTPAGETAVGAWTKYPSNYLAWYENDGQGHFSEARVIEPNGHRISDYFRRWSASAVDLDADGDLDVLANLHYGGWDRKASEDEDLENANQYKIGTAWYENEGGGQFSAGRPLSYADAPTVADLDGDADGDLVVLYRRISWVANEGGGRFATRGWLEADLRTAGTPTYRAQAADMDGDGDADVVGGTEGGVFWYENHGRGGAFAAPRWAQGGGVNTYRTGATAGLHVVDMDGDADPDVLVAGPWHLLGGPYQIAWFENEGGSLTRKPIADGLVTSVHASDLDGDGDMDVLAASDSGVVLHENHGAGFSAGELIVASEVEAVHAADVDGDGDADVLYGSSTGDTIGWLRNTTERREPSPATLVVALPAFLHGALESTTDRDRYRVATGNGTLTVRTNGPTNTVGSLLRADETQLAEDDNAGVATNFALRAEVEAGAHFIDVRGTDGATGGYTLAIAFEAADDHGDAAESATPVMAPRVVWGRLQHDDDRDVFRIDAPEDHVIEVDAGEHGLALTDAQGTTLASAAAGAVLRYVTPRGTPGSTNPYFIHVVASGATPSAYTLTIGYSRAPSSVHFSRQGTAFTEYNFHLADVDGDGDADLIAGNEWWESPQWPARRTIADQPEAVDRVADLDADGDLDLLSASESITWRENQGDAAFGAQRLIGSETTDVVHGPLQAADLDGDGDLDVMATRRPLPYETLENDIAGWYENQGDGAFSESRALVHDSAAACALDSSGLRWWEIPATVCPRMYLPADLDGDGLVDLIGSRNRRLIWFQNPGQTSGDARFSDPRAIGNVPIYSWDEARRVDRANSVHVADLDGDGDADIVAAVGYFEAAEEGAVVWHENEGGGEFAPQRPLPQTENGPALAVRAADLDGDRDLDIVAVYERTYSHDCTDICEWDEIVWHENRGSGSFAPERNILSGHEVGFSGLRLADMDSDGDADIIFLRSEVNDVVVYSVQWYENLADHGDDHGNTAAEAILTPVLPALVHGVLESPDDRDVFRVATGTGTLRVITNGPTDTLGAVMDAEGRELAADDNSGTDANFALETQVTSGTHYVMVRGNGSNTGPYTLSLFFATPR